MNNINTIPVQTEVEPQNEIALDVSTLDSIDNWYRSLGPDYDMRTVPYETQIDALASSVLHATGREISDRADERVKTALSLTTDIGKVGREIALGGPDNLLISDLIQELVESQPALPARIRAHLLGVSKTVAVGIRDNPLTSPETKIKANTRFVNASIAELEIGVNPREGKSNSDTYIDIVRGEARWMSQHTRDVRSGDLFEVFIGCLAKHQVWTAEEDDHQTARHATRREDQPTPRKDGGRGHNTAHDVVVKSRALKALLQCKWGTGSYEQESRYDSNKVVFITETTDDETLSNRSMFVEAFEAIASSNKPESMDECDRYVQQYGIDRVVEAVKVATPQAAGSLALIGANK